MGKPALRPGRFLERIATFYPGVEIVAEVDLDPAKDPYLREHALKGSPLFPAVLGLEAMAQAAAALAGAPPNAFEKVAFDRPVVLGGERMLVRVAALRHEDGRIETVLRSAETGFQAEHFRAVASLAAGGAASPSPPPDQTPTLLSSDALYGSLLFHAGRFRRVAGYASLSATSCVAHITPDPEARWFPALDADRLLIGDPGARDAAMHALQACIPHRRVLPIAVRRIELGRLLSDRPYAVHAAESGRQGDRFVFDVEIRDTDGHVAERWEGLELRAIEPLPALADWPAALAGAFLERKFGELLPSAGLRVALAAGGCSSETLLDGLLGPQDRLQRRADGKPEAAAAVSASHAGDLTLAITGVEPAGCDIEPVVERPEPVWRDLLGGERFELARLMARDCGEKLAAATALEALKKAGAATTQAPLTLGTSDGGWITLSSGDFTVVTWIAKIERQRVSVAAASAKALVARAAYSYRHVVGFGETNLVGNVYFVNHLEWQGRCREMFLRDKAPSVLEELRNGLSLVTTKCSCNYLAELTAFDEVRLDMRLNGIAGSQIAFAFEYWRCGERGDELVATGEQEVACVRTLDGQKAPSEPPTALRAALRAYDSDGSAAAKGARSLGLT
jgi:enediyne polyketide synthase